MTDPGRRTARCPWCEPASRRARCDGVVERTEWLEIDVELGSENRGHYIVLNRLLVVVLGGTGVLALNPAAQWMTADPVGTLPFAVRLAGRAGVNDQFSNGGCLRVVKAGDAASRRHGCADGNRYQPQQSGADRLRREPKERKRHVHEAVEPSDGINIPQRPRRCNTVEFL